MPDFIKKANAEREIIRASDASFRTKEGQVIYLRGFREGVGRIDMVFRAQYRTERMLGKNSDKVLCDEFQRPIPIFDGFVVQEEAKGSFTKAQLDAVFERIQPEFIRFWNDKDGRIWRPVAIPAFELPPPEGTPLVVEYKESPTLPREALSRETLPREASRAGSASQQDKESEGEAKIAGEPDLKKKQIPTGKMPRGLDEAGESNRKPDVTNKIITQETHSPDFQKALGESAIYTLGLGGVISSGICIAIFAGGLPFKITGVVMTVFGIMIFLKSLQGK